MFGLVGLFACLFVCLFLCSSLAGFPSVIDYSLCIFFLYIHAITPISAKYSQINEINKHFNERNTKTTECLRAK